MWIDIENKPFVKKGEMNHFLMTFEHKECGKRWVREVVYLNEYRLDCDDEGLYQKLADDATEFDALVPFTGWFWECTDRNGDIFYQEIHPDDGHTKMIAWLPYPEPAGTYV